MSPVDGKPPAHSSRTQLPTGTLHSLWHSRSSTDGLSGQPLLSFAKSLNQTSAATGTGQATDKGEVSSQMTQEQQAKPSACRRGWGGGLEEAWEPNQAVWHINNGYAQDKPYLGSQGSGTGTGPVSRKDMDRGHLGRVSRSSCSLSRDHHTAAQIPCIRHSSAPLQSRPHSAPLTVASEHKVALVVPTEHLLKTNLC